VQTRLILGPAGSGKTFRCLAEIRQALASEPDGPPLLLIAPKQTTYQLERQLLAHSSVPGFTRLHILSFDRLAFFLFAALKKPAPRMLDEEGRLMVLRGLLARNRDQLKLYRASARLTGFAQHLSESLRELQRHQLTPETLHELARRAQSVEGLGHKLHDLATMLHDYLDWLKSHKLEDSDHLLEIVTATLRAGGQQLQFGDLWVDGFTEYSLQELELLAELMPHVRSASLTFCLDHVPTEKTSWLSTWSAARQTYQKCCARLASVPNCELGTELLERDPGKSRFMRNAVLRHLETAWADPTPFASVSSALPQSLQIAACATPEAEAVFAAREILRFVRRGGRYREVTVLVRNLESYHGSLASVFARYDIPFFMDRRESVAHHPLAELTRNALRTVTSGWKHDDWFAALKTGLVRVLDSDVDHLENEALAHGWRGTTWSKPLNIPDEPQVAAKLERVRARIVPPFHKLEQQLAIAGRRPTGPQLADALRALWKNLDVEETLREWSESDDGPEPTHLTVWEQMNAWLRNVELAFPTESCSMQDWLPIVEAGLGNLTVGAIPPALDQVLMGAIDRSRNPDIRLALVLGMNESVFPAPPKPPVLLTDSDREALEKQGVALGGRGQQQISLERFYGYVACTRARERLVLTYSLSDPSGKPLNPSPFLAQIRRLFPALEVDAVPSRLDWHESQHANELIEPLLRDHLRRNAASDQSLAPVSSAEALTLASLANLPALKPLRDSLRHFAGVAPVESLSPAVAEQLYGPALRTSVSRMEQFAACPFKFLVHSGLRAEERKRFELDVRDQGNFQHEVLMQFHNQLREEGKRWRDISPVEARDRVEKIAVGLSAGFREGIMRASEQNQFTARVLTESLQDFVETLIGWMREQYAFDPVRVELPFEQESGEFPAWKVELGNGRHLSLQGRIDRIDIHGTGQAQEALCVVVDYKSSQRALDPLMMEHGLQLQLPAYLNVLRHWPNPAPLFGVGRLIPAGVFYVNLRGRYDSGGNRDDALEDVEAARKRAYRHTGRFDGNVLDLLDNRGASEGDQFNYRRNKDGRISGNSREALDGNAFVALLDAVEISLRQMGQGIYAGVAQLDPFRKGRLTACNYCEYQSICRIDPWTHSYRVLRRKSEEESGDR
jgi:ATP-dependent helicase/nuclease subunit B